MFEKVNINYYTGCGFQIHLFMSHSIAPPSDSPSIAIHMYPNNNIFKRPLKSVNTIKVSLDIIENVHLNLCFNVYNYIICVYIIYVHEFPYLKMLKVNKGESEERSRTKNYRQKKKD